jgi:hypothetical protein
MRLLELTEALADHKLTVEYGNFVELFVPMLEQNCQQIVDIYKKLNNGRVLFRGEHDYYDEQVRDIRINRKPVQMRRDYAEIIQEAYTDLNITAHRQNSIFTTPMRGRAEDWGNAYIVFPYDGFQFSYFENLVNGQYAYVTFDNLLRDSIYELRLAANLRYDEAYLIDENWEDLVYEVMQTIIALEPRTSDLPYAINNNCEVLIAGTRYHSFDVDKWGKSIITWITQ